MSAAMGFRKSIAEEYFNQILNLVNGVNIAGFLKVANAMLDQGLV